ncbi:MAG: SCO family protein, partial [Magnetococcales bacterium]|nr:SCO family protein [Magnetococcales bacterium]
SARGYDHLVQATLVDGDGRISQQVYGEVFDTQLLVEPLKALLMGQPLPQLSWLERVSRRLRLICTTYDPRQDRYRFDYSIFIETAVGASVLVGGMLFLIRGRRRSS